jgi:hypothetical protein
MDNEIRDLLKKVILKHLKEQLNGQTVTQEDVTKAKGKIKTLIDTWNDADKNDIERAKVEAEKLKNENERLKIDNQQEIERLKIENEKERNAIEREKVDVERIKANCELEKVKVEDRRLDIELEHLRIEKETAETRAKWDFWKGVGTAFITLVGTVVSLYYVNRWTKWGFTQEEFGTIVGKTFNNVQKEWKIKRL